MFSMFKPKKEVQPTYETVARKEFSQSNLFVHCLRDILGFSPGKEDLLAWLKEAEKDDNYSKWFYLHSIRTNTEIFTLNNQTKDYLKILMETSYLIGKCSDIFQSTAKKDEEYLINDLVAVVYLLQEVDTSLRKGVPLDHKTIIDAVVTIHQLLEEKINIYYQVSSENLVREIQIAKQLRLDYQDRKEECTLSIEKPKERPLVGRGSLTVDM